MADATPGTEASALVLDRCRGQLAPIWHRTSCLYELAVLELCNQADSPTIGSVVEEHQVFDLLSDSPQ